MAGATALRYKLGADGATLVLQREDITRLALDAIVNAANERMLGGGGVDGAIHRAAGPALREACEAVEEVRPNVRCPTGEARITPGFELPARYVIHTVGPVYQGPQSSVDLINTSRNALELARANDVTTIAFPAISCGVYGYPVTAAARVAIDACRQHATSFHEVHFALFSEEAFHAFRKAANAALKPV